MRTQKEIQRQVDGLKVERKTLPEFSFFGNKNWTTIDAVIEFLTHKTNKNHQYIDETSDEFTDGDNDEYFAVERAEDWLIGYSDEDLFSK